MPSAILCDRVHFLFSSSCSTRNLIIIISSLSFFFIIIIISSSSNNIMHSYPVMSSRDATSSISCLKEEESEAYKEYKQQQQQQSRTMNSSSVRFSQELFTICDSLFADGPSPTTSSSDDRESSFETRTRTRTTSGTTSEISSKVDKVLHVQVLQDERRRQKVEALRDAILDEQIELWASSTSDTNTLFEKKLALLSWKHSLKDVSEALVFASELEDFLSWSSSSS